MQTDLYHAGQVRSSHCAYAISPVNGNAYPDQLRNSDSSPDPYTRYASIVARVHAGQNDGMEELYNLFQKGVRWHYYRHLGEDNLDDEIHDLFLTMVLAIRAGQLQQPHRLMGYVRSVTRRRISLLIKQRVRARLTEDPAGTVDLEDTRSGAEATMSQRDRQAVMRRTLNKLRPEQREVLVRFYVHEQSKKQICEEMGLTETQFRLAKSRAKARFGKLGQEKCLRPRLGLN